jgi:hypothetical protein
MIIDLREKYISNQFGTNLSILVNDNFELIYFMWNENKIKIPCYSIEEDSIHVYFYNQREYILPNCLTYKKN